jgi:hypothetical protein
MDDHVPAAGPRLRLDESIRDMLHEVRLVRACLGSQIDRLDRMELYLTTMQGGRIATGSGQPAPAPERVAHNLEIGFRHDGFGVVSIDGGRKFVLAPQLAEVFRFIATGDRGRSEKDPLVGWRSRDEIREFLADSEGRSYTQRYVNNLVHRLRQALRQAGYDLNLIQSHRQKGVRFAFKRGAKLME